MRFLPPKPPAVEPPPATMPSAGGTENNSPPALETETETETAVTPASGVTSRPSLRDTYNPGSSRASLISSSSIRSVGKLNKTASWMNRNQDVAPNQEDTSVSSLEEEKEPAQAKTVPPPAPGETKETTEAEIPDDTKQSAAKGLPWMQQEANKPKEPPAWMKKLKKTVSARSVKVSTEEAAAELATEREVEPASETEVKPEIETATTEDSPDASNLEDSAASKNSEPEKKAIEELPKRRSVKDLGGWLTKTIDDKHSQKAQAPITGKTAPKTTSVAADSEPENKPTEPHVRFADKDTGSLAETTAASTTPATDASLEGSSRAGSTPDAPSVSNTIMTDESEYEEVIEEDESEIVEVTEHDDDDDDDEEEEEVLEVTEHDDGEIIEEVTEREDDEIVEEVTEREDDEIIEEVTEREDDDIIEEVTEREDEEYEDEEVVEEDEEDEDEEVIEEEAVYKDGDVVEEEVDNYTETELVPTFSKENDEQNLKAGGGALVAVAASPTPAPVPAQETVTAQSMPSRSSMVSKEDYKEPNDVDALQSWVTGFEEGEASKVTSKQPNRPYPFEVYDSEKSALPAEEGVADTGIEREPTTEPSASATALSQPEEGEENSRSSLLESEVVSAAITANQALPTSEGDGDTALVQSDSQGSQEAEQNESSLQKAETETALEVASATAVTATDAITGQDDVEEEVMNETVGESGEEGAITIGGHQMLDKADEDKAKVEEEILVEEEDRTASESKTIVPVVHSDESMGDIETGQATEDSNETSAIVVGGAAGTTGAIVAANASTGADPSSGAVKTEEEKDDSMPFYSVIIVLLFLAVISLFAILIWGTGTIDITGGDDFVGNKPTTPFDPYVPGDCNFSDQSQPHVISQCSCNDEITTLTNNAREKYDALVSDFLVPSIYSEWTLPLESCEPENQALVWLSTSMANTSTDLTQRYLMAFLYFSTNGPQWETQTLWLEEDDLCTWYGLSCGDDNVMREIGLESNSLLGKVPAEISLLTGLETISIYQNALSGTFPKEIFGLPELTIAVFGSNRFYGSLPSEIAGASKLKILELNDNQLDGLIITELGAVTSLVELNLGGNSFEGEVPREMFLLTNLVSLNIENNMGIEGRLPTDFSLLTDLRTLSVSGTNMRSRIPAEYLYLTKMEDLRIANTQVGGTIPMILAELTNLKHLDLSGSNFRQAIPDYIGKFQSLDYLALSNNAFTKEIPPQIGNLTQIKTLLLEGNELTGAVPSQLGQLTTLETLSLEGNFLTGRTPNELCSLRNSSMLETVTVDCPAGSLGVLCPIPTCCTGCRSISSSANETSSNSTRG